MIRWGPVASGKFWSDIAEQWLCVFAGRARILAGRLDVDPGVLDGYGHRSHPRSDHLLLVARYRGTRLSLFKASAALYANASQPNRSRYIQVTSRLLSDKPPLGTATAQMLTFRAWSQRVTPPCPSDDHPGKLITRITRFRALLLPRWSNVARSLTVGAWQSSQMTRR